MINIYNDIKYGFRQLRKNPGFTAIAILTLALGLGINTSVFSVINTVLLRPLPFTEPDRLVRISAIRERATFLSEEILSYPDFADWREQSRSFINLAAYTSESKDIITNKIPENMWGLTVSQGFFDILGVNPILGRTFIEGEDQPGSPGVIVLSHNMWKQHFSGNSDILGQTVLLDEDAYTVVGVLPVDFPSHLIDNAEFFIPLKERRGRDYACYTVIGRIGPDVTLAQARERLSTMAARLHEENQEAIAGAHITPFFEYVIGNTHLYLLALLGATGFVLLIACVNLANLMLARTTARQKEIAVRRALGAGLFRVAWQLFIESILLTVIGSMCGLLLAFWTSDLLRLYLIRIVPRANEINIDGRVMCFTLIMAIGTGLLVAIAPVLRLRGCTPHSLLGERLKSSSVRNRLSDALIVFEISAAIVLLMGAGLMIRTFYNLTTANPGFDADHLLSFRVRLPSSRYENATQRQAFCQQAIDRISGLPGVDSIAMSNMIPYGRAGNYTNVFIPGRSAEEIGEFNNIGCHVITSDYLSTLDIPLFSGRPFEPHDFSEKVRTVLINQKLAQTCWPDENPLGQHITLGYTNESYEIIGIVGNTHQENPTEEVEMNVYLPYGSAIADKYRDLHGFVVRTNKDPASLVADIRTAMLEVDPILPIQRLAPMRQQMAGSIRQERFTLISLGLFAGLALVLVVIGIYGVVSYLVSRRTNEVGIRIALGAQYSNIMGMILKKGLILAITGSTIGITGALGLTRFLSSYLYGITPTDPVTFVLVPVILIAIALLACFIPARRASKVDPMEALRYE